MKREGWRQDTTRNHGTSEQNCTTNCGSPANAGLGVHDPLSIMIEKTDLVAILTFFELLAEWESKEGNNANEEVTIRRSGCGFCRSKALGWLLSTS
jgi:hypothetical protein